MSKLKKDVKAIVISTIVGILTAFSTAIITHYYNSSILSLDFNSIMQAPYDFFASIYFRYSVPMRFNLFLWLMAFFIYYILEVYDKKYQINEKRDIVKENMKARTFFVYSLSVFAGLIYIDQTRIPTSDVMSTLLDVVGIITTLIGFVIFMFGRVEIDGLWGPHLYSYKDKSLHKIITSGVYNKMRHPIYMGQFILALSTFILSKSWLFVVFPMFVIIFNTFRATQEENYLTEQFGEQYLDYKKKVKKWWFW